MAAQRITVAALLVLVVALTGCGSQVIDRVVEKTPDGVGTTTTTVATLATTTTVDPQPTTTSAAFPVVEAVPPVPVDDIDPMLDEMDAALAELDQLFNNAAAALAAEEGEFIP